MRIIIGELTGAFAVARASMPESGVIRVVLFSVHGICLINILALLLLVSMLFYFMCMNHVQCVLTSILVTRENGNMF